MRNLMVLSLVLSLFQPSISYILPPAGSIQSPLLAPSKHRAADQEIGEDEGVWRVDLGGLTSRDRGEVLRMVERLELDVWKQTHSYIDLRTDPNTFGLLADLLPHSAETTPWLPNVSSLIDESISSLSSGSNLVDYPTDNLDTPFHDSYHSLEEIHAFGDALITSFRGKVGISMDRFTAGKSSEGRDIVGWTVSMAPSAAPAVSLVDEDLPEQAAEAMEELRKGRKGPKLPKAPKAPKGGKKNNSTEPQTREIVIQSGQHAREWVGPSTAMYFLHSLLLAVTADPTSEAATLLQHYTFTVVPTINPDGLVYSQGGKTQRLWRKNRQPTTGETCEGIDLNSNWGYKWRPVGSPSPCSDSYPGSSAFEAYETRAMANYLANGTTYGSGEPPKKNRRVRSFVDLHSYGQLFMFPFAHSCDDFPSDAETLMEAGLGVAKAMRTVHGEGYQSGQACDLTYRAPGDAIDFAYGVTDVRFSYSAELRDTGTYGFLLPPSLIRPAAEETAAGLMYLAKFIYNLEIIN